MTFETVGGVRPDSRARVARDDGPLRWIASRILRSLIRRRRAGSARSVFIGCPKHRAVSGLP